MNEGNNEKMDPLLNDEHSLADAGADAAELLDNPERTPFLMGEMEKAFLRLEKIFEHDMNGPRLPGEDEAWIVYQELGNELGHPLNFVQSKDGHIRRSDENNLGG